jgi:hypothetical protein
VIVRALALFPANSDMMVITRIARRGRSPCSIAFFKPKKVTRESVAEMLTKVGRVRKPAELNARVEKVMGAIARGPIRPNPPVSQSLADVADPVYGLGTHPDIVDRMWELDDSLPQKCRWVFWGGPALVHPQAGVVFAVGYGTIGYVMRLPSAILKVATEDQASAVVAGNPGHSFDIGPAGPEWRFIRRDAPETEWCRAAYDFAGEPAS